jgi:F-type H+-transporting ATPase subunit gamma
MAQIREVKKRIKSIENTKKVTHAMELVAAAKMKRSQQQALTSRPYTLTLAEVLGEIKSKVDKSKHLLLQPTDIEKQMIIILTSDRGLAGGLNFNLFREILRSEVKNAIYVAIGKKATNFVSKTGGELIASFASGEKSPLDLSRTLRKIAIDAFADSQVSKVKLVYPHFESTMKQVPKWITLLPIELETDDPLRPRSEANQLPGTSYQIPTNLLFEPNVDQILEDILPHHVLTEIYQAILEARASELSARMIAMKNATDAAGDLIDDLTLTYNQVRQETITKELLDITTAQKAFE